MHASGPWVIGSASGVLVTWADLFGDTVENALEQARNDLNSPAGTGVFLLSPAAGGWVVHGTNYYSFFLSKSGPQPGCTTQRRLPAAGLVSFLKGSPADQQFFPRGTRSALVDYPLSGFLQVGRVTRATFLEMQPLLPVPVPAPPHGSSRCRLRAARGSLGLGPPRLGFYADSSTCCSGGGEAGSAQARDTLVAQKKVTGGKVADSRGS